jgi:hypothetical protein
MARRRFAAGGEVERQERCSGRLDDDGKVEKLPGNVRKLEPRSIGAREGRERESHGEPTRRRQESSGSSSGSQCRALGTQWIGRGASWG